MVIMMNWYSKYLNRPEFMAHFDSEQDYVDAMFTMIVMFNFGVWVEQEDMLTVEVA